MLLPNSALSNQDGAHARRATETADLRLVRQGQRQCFDVRVPSVRIISTCE